MSDPRALATMVAARSLLVLLTLGLLGLGLAACGAKTGLPRPDAEVDAEPPIDAEPPPPDAEPPPPICVEVPPEVGPVRVSITLPVTLAVVDLFFVIDATASMLDEIDNVRTRLRSRVVPGARESIPDVAFGVALIGEFPERPHGPADVRPYELRAPVTRDVVAVEGALERIPSWGNRDEPEAQVEGLFQVVTGEGLAPWIEPSLGCAGGGLGGACFRLDSLPVILLITDAPMHNGPGGANPYRFTGTRRGPHTFDEAVSAIRAIDGFVIGLGARDPGSDSPMPHLRSIAQSTGAIDARGNPLAFDIGSTGGGVGESIVDAVERLAEGLPLDVDAVVRDVPGDAFDAAGLVTAVRAVSATPPSGVGSIEPERFVAVVPGTQVVFELEVDTSSLPASDVTREIPGTILFRAFGRSRLGTEDIVILVPGTDGGGCDEGEAIR